MRATPDAAVARDRDTTPSTFPLKRMGGVARMARSCGDDARYSSLGPM